MNSAQFAELTAWITETGLAGRTETATLEGFCERLLGFGLPLARATVVIDTLHPTYEGHAFTWRRDIKKTTITEYGRSSAYNQRWEKSPFYRLYISGDSLLRRHLTPESVPEFPILSDLHAEGMTEYIAMVNRFAAEGIIGDMDCVYSSWATDAPEGFQNADVAALNRLVPLLALTPQSAAMARIAATLNEPYL